MSTSISQLMKGMGAAHSEGSTSASKMMPFGTKTEMVEIVPLQSVTTASNGEYEPTTGTECNGALSVEGNYVVVFDGNEYNVTCIYDEGCETLGDKYINIFETYPFNIYQEEAGWVKICTPSEGTHTLAIYEEQEVVTPIDPKFTGSATFLTYSEDDELRYVRRYNPVTNELGEKVTKEELLNAMVRGVVYTTGSYSYEGNYGYIYPIEMIQFVSDYASIRISGSGTSNYLYTSEYTEAAGPR